jgi:hypothetical protein
METEAEANKIGEGGVEFVSQKDDQMHTATIGW